MDELSPQEVGWLVSNHYEKEKEKYELFAYAVQVGYVKAKTGKKFDMFEKPRKSSSGYIDKEEKARELAKLDEIFGGS